MSCWRANPRSRDRVVVGLSAAIFALQVAAQIALTPLGEGMDEWSHWARVEFRAATDRCPRPEERSAPLQLIELERDGPGPGHARGGRYAEWAARPAAERASLRRRWIAPWPDPPDFAAPTYEAQQGPLYYAMMAPLARALRGTTLDVRRWGLAVLSVMVAATAVPAWYRVLRLRLEPAAATVMLLAMVWLPNWMPFVGRIANDAFALPLMSWAFVLLIEPRPAPGRDLAAAAMITIAIFAKAYALVLLPIALVLMMWSLVREQPRTARWVRMATVGLLATAPVLLFATQHRIAGHILPFIHVLGSRGASWWERIAAFADVNWWWWLKGLVRGAIWCGYWSFVSPGLWFYGPAIALLFLVGVRRRSAPMVAANETHVGRRLFVAWGVLTTFLVAMAVHAATFALVRARIGGEPSGNEGWYAMAFAAPAAAVLADLVARRCGPGACVPWCTMAAGGVVAWNLVARVVMGLYWSGLVPLEPGLRRLAWSRMQWPDSASTAVAAWFDCPGVLQPVMLTSLLPLAVALLLSGVVVRYSHDKAMTNATNETNSLGA